MTYPQDQCDIIRRIIDRGRKLSLETDRQRINPTSFTDIFQHLEDEFDRLRYWLDGYDWEG